MTITKFILTGSKVEPSGTELPDKVEEIFRLESTEPTVATLMFMVLKENCPMLRLHSYKEVTERKTMTRDFQRSNLDNPFVDRLYKIDVEAYQQQITSEAATELRNKE